MWLILIFIIIISIVLGVWMYNKIITKNVVEYYPNGRVKLKGVTKFKHRIGVFELFNETGNLYSRFHYGNGELFKEEYLNADTGNVWKTIQKSNPTIDIKLRFAETKLFFDRNSVLEAVKCNGQNLQYASENLKNDYEIVHEAIQNDGSSIKYASRELKSDKDLVLIAVQKFGGSLQYVSSELKEDNQVVLAAVTSSGMALEYASEKLRNDREVVLQALKDRDMGSLKGAIEFADVSFRSDKAIMLQATSVNYFALKYATDDIKSDKEVVLNAVKLYFSALEFASPILKNDCAFLYDVLNSADYTRNDVYIECYHKLILDNYQNISKFQYLVYRFLMGIELWTNKNGIRVILTLMIVIAIFWILANFIYHFFLFLAIRVNLLNEASQGDWLMFLSFILSVFIMYQSFNLGEKIIKKITLSILSTLKSNQLRY